MKKKKILMAIIAVTIIMTLFSGCNSIKYGKEYYEYYFSQSKEMFVRTGKSIYINRDKTMSVYYDENIIECTYEHDKNTDYIAVDYVTQLTKEMLDEYKEYLQQNGEGEISIADIEKIINQLNIKDNYHFHKNYVFSESSVAAYKFVDFTQEFNAEYQQIEGTYYVRESAKESQKMKLSEGIIYAQDSYAQEGKYPVVRGTYTIEKDFLVMKFKSNSETKTEYIVRYLIADIAIPEIVIDGDIDEDKISDDEKWILELKQKLATLKGKKMKCLVSVFNSTAPNLL